jgi:hypothetical protein
MSTQVNSTETSEQIEIINNPFKGPESFTGSDRNAFYGRNKEITDLIQLIDQYTLTLLYSKSGVGKTSMINAGLIPLLEKYRNYLPVYIRLDKNCADISGSVVSAIKEAAVTNKIEIYTNAVVGSEHSITDFLYNSIFYSKRINQQIFKLETLTVDAINEEKLTKPQLTGWNKEDDVEMETGTYSSSRKPRQIFNPNNNKTWIEENIKHGWYTEIIPVMLFDQFEEIFTLDFEQAALQTFIDDITFLIESKIPEEFYTHYEEKHEHKKEFNILKLRLQKAEKWYRIMFSFREEYLASFESLKEQIPSIFYSNGRYQLETFSLETAIEIIIKTSGLFIPIKRSDAKLLTQAISKTETKSGTAKFKDEAHPFLLSLICRELYPKIIARDSKLIDELRASNFSSVDNLIGDYCKKVFSKVPSSIRAFVEDNLITRDGKRMMYPLPDLSEKKKKYVRDLMDPKLRYLNTVEYFEVTNIEILHDKLIKPLVKSRKEREKWNDLKRIGFIAGALTLVLAAILWYNSDQLKRKEVANKRYEQFLRETNGMILKDLDSTIQMNTIAGLIKSMDYNTNLKNTFGDVGINITGFEDSVFKRFTGRTFYYSYTGNGINYTYSPKALYRYYRQTAILPDDNKNKQLGAINSLEENKTVRVPDDTVVIENYTGRKYEILVKFPTTKKEDYEYYEKSTVISQNDSLLVFIMKDSIRIYDLKDRSSKKIKLLASKKLPMLITNNYYSDVFFSSDNKLLLFRGIGKKAKYYQAYHLRSEEIMQTEIPLDLFWYDVIIFYDKGRVNYISSIYPKEQIYDGYRNRYIGFNLNTPNKKEIIKGHSIFYSSDGSHIINDSTKSYLVSPNLNAVKINIGYSLEINKIDEDRLLIIDTSGKLQIYSINKNKFLTSSEKPVIDTSIYDVRQTFISPNKDMAVIVYQNKSLSYGIGDSTFFTVFKIADVKRPIQAHKYFGMIYDIGFFQNDVLILGKYNRNLGYSLYKNEGNGDSLNEIDYYTWYYTLESPKSVVQLNADYQRFKKQYQK